MSGRLLWEHMQKQDKILVTGASGLIGSALVRLLKKEQYENVLTPTHEELDWTQQEAVQVYFFHTQPEYVFHLAAHVGGIRDNNSNPAQFIYNNTLMQCNVFEESMQCDVKKLLFPGSACAYPAITDRPIKESDFLTGIPETTNLAYAVAKQNGIVMAQSYAKEHGMKVVLPMVANTYGLNDKSSHVIPDLIKKFKNSCNSIALWGSGGYNFREFIYADDVAAAFLFLMNSYDSQDIINIGTSEEITIYNLAKMISDIINPNIDIRYDLSELEGVKRKCLDSSRIKAMGWKPTISLEEGLRRVIAS